MLADILFYMAGATLLVSALGVVFAKNPLRGALLLIVALCSMAMLFVLLDASFVAAMQILVYAGAIMVLFTFVIMLLNLQPGMSGRAFYWSWSKTFGALSGVYLFVLIMRGAGLLSASAGQPVDGSVKTIGRLLLTQYLFGFEAISVLLLVAVVGAVVLGLKRLS